MSDDETIDDRIYAGPSKTIEVLGRGNAYGWVGSVLGFVVGGISSLLGTRTPGKFTKKATDLFKEIGINLNGKWPIVAGGALVGLQIGHFLGFAIGVRSGAKKAGAGQEQFERISEDNAKLRGEVQALKYTCTATHLDIGENGKLPAANTKPDEPAPVIETRDSKAEGLTVAPGQSSGITQR